MPELPEVEVVRLGITPLVTGATVREVRVLDERSLRRHVGPSEDFEHRIRGRKLAEPKRRGKFLWIPLEPESGSLVPSEALLVHLGMSGQVLLANESEPNRLTRIAFTLESPDGTRFGLNFVDQRIFGSLSIDNLVDVGTGELIPSKVLHIARDPLDPKFDEEAFSTKLKSRKTGIKRALLDQNLISGIGNIYADESLWASRIHFDTPTNLISRRKVAELIQSVRAVLQKALAEGGTSFDWQYRNVNGESGYFSHSLNAYGQQGKPCPRCGKPIKREKFMNRSSHYCPNCQKRLGL